MVQFDVSTILYCMLHIRHKADQLKIKQKFGDGCVALTALPIDDKKDNPTC